MRKQKQVDRILFVTRKYMLDNLWLIIMQYVISVFVIGIILGMIHNVKELMKNNSIEKLIFTYDIELDETAQFEILRENFREEDIAEVEYYTISSVLEEDVDFGIVFDEKNDCYNTVDSSDLKIILGRNFSPKDFKNKADKIIINNEFMKENYPNYDTGDIIQIGNIEYEIIGICANAENDIYITYNHLQNEKDAFNLRQVVIRFSHMLNHSQKEILDSMAEVKQLIYDNADTLMEYVSCVFLILINLVIFGTTIVCLNRILSENYCKVYHLYHVLGIHDGYLLFSKIFVFVMIEILALFTMLSIYNPFNLVYRSFIK